MFSKFKQFEKYKHIFNNDDFDHSCLLDSPVVFMRWKEQFTLPNHRGKSETLKLMFNSVSFRDQNQGRFVRRLLLHLLHKGTRCDRGLLLWQGCRAESIYKSQYRQETFYYSIQIHVTFFLIAVHTCKWVKEINNFNNSTNVFLQCYSYKGN